MKSAWSLLLVVLAVLPGGTVRAASPPAELGQHWIDGYVHPQTTALVQAAGAVDTALSAYCAAPGDAAAYEAVRARVGALAQAWGRIEFLRFGPLVEANRFERFAFFPDPRGLVQKQVGALLAAADAAVLEEGALAARSVAVQGLPALDHALFAIDAAGVIGRDDAAGRYRCAYARAVARTLGRTAGEIAQGWSTEGMFAREFARPVAGNRLYRTPAEVAAEGVKALSGGIQFVRDIKLAPALGTGPDSARGQRLPLWRSGATARLLSGTVTGMRDFLDAGRLGEALAADARWVPAAFHDEATRIAEGLDAVPLPLDRALTEPEARAAIELVMLQLKNLQDINDAFLAPALGVNIGFNAFDGD